MKISLKDRVKILTNYSSLSRQLNWPYQKLVWKLNGYSKLKPEEEKAIKEQLKIIEEEKRAIAAITK